MINLDFRPRLFDLRKSYSKEKFLKDLMAGIIVGIVALPLAIAFGIASGVSPEKGLITAIIGGFIVSFLGGSSVQIGGPTGAFIVIVYGIIEKFGVEGLAIATVVAGAILLLMGLMRLGTVIRFIPYPIVVGFTSGIAVTIFTTQIKDLFGLQIDKMPGDFISKWSVYFENFATLGLVAAAIGIFSVVIIFLFPKISNKIPGSLAAILIMTVIAYVLRTYFNVGGIETIGDRFTFQSSLPRPQGLPISMETIRMLLPSAFTIAMLGAIESLLSASVADGSIGEKHNSNTELMAQGVANIVVPFFGGIPVTGAIARTMTNINNGGRSPIAGIVHTIVLLLILLFLGPLTSYIPMACLAGVLVVVSYNMSEWRSFKLLLQGPRSDVVVLLVTFLLTVILDLTIAIEIGMLLTMLLFMRRVYQTTEVTVTKNKIDFSKEAELANPEEPLDVSDKVEIYEINGPFFFGIANRFDEATKVVGDHPYVRILRMRRVPFMDSTGAHNLSMLVKNSKAEHIHLILSGVNPDVRKVLSDVGIEKALGSENVCSDIHEALRKADLFVQSKQEG